MCSLLAHYPNFSLAHSMTSPREIIANWQARLLGDPELAQIMNATYKIILEGVGGGTWLFDLRQPIKIRELSGSENSLKAQCTITIRADDLVRISEKKLNPQAAYMAHAIRVEGETAMALHWASLI